MSIVACLKWLARPDAPDDERFAGVSPADRAALEVALTLGEQRGEPVVVMTAGPAGAERALRTAVACGAARVVRIDLPVDAESRDVADALADEIERLDSNGQSTANGPGLPRRTANPLLYTSYIDSADAPSRGSL
jgi:hypothetical protein